MTENLESDLSAHFRALCFAVSVNRHEPEAAKQMSPKEKLIDGAGLLVGFNADTLNDILKVAFVAMEDQNFHTLNFVIEALQVPEKREKLVSLAISMIDDPEDRKYWERTWKDA